METGMAAKKYLREEILAREGIAWLTLNRPEKKNAMSRELLSELIDSLKKLRENRGIRVIVTTGMGDSYSSGLDLFDQKKRWQRPRRWGGQGSTREVIHLLRNAPQVTIAAVNGYCLGAGLVLVNAHDVAIAADSAQLGLPEIIRGSFGAEATATLFHAGVPFKKAFYMQMSGRRLSGEEAERIGLVSKVVPERELTQFVKTLAREIAGRNPAALEHAKIAAYMDMELEFSQALQNDELVAYRMRSFTDPLRDVQNYLKSQKRIGAGR
jgi:enoyl-CoA hydratase/carnithine racemase